MTSAQQANILEAITPSHMKKLSDGKKPASPAAWPNSQRGDKLN